MKFFGSLVFENGLGQVEFQFLAIELIEVQGELLLGALVHPLEKQAPGEFLQPVEFRPQLPNFFPAVVVQGHQPVDIHRGRFFEHLFLLPGLLLQEVQLKRHDL